MKRFHPSLIRLMCRFNEQIFYTKFEETGPPIFSKVKRAVFLFKPWDSNIGMYGPVLSALITIIFLLDQCKFTSKNSLRAFWHRCSWSSRVDSVLRRPDRPTKDRTLLSLATSIMILLQWDHNISMFIVGDVIDH